MNHDTTPPATDKVSSEDTHTATTSSTADADHLMAPDKKNSILKKDGGSSIFSLTRHQQAEGRSDRQTFIDGKTITDPPQELHDRMKHCQRAKQESEETENRQPGPTHTGGMSSGKPDHGLECGKYEGMKCVDQNVHEDHDPNLNEKDLELCEDIESRERELQQILLLESQAYKECLLLEEEILKESLINRGRDLTETFELRGKVFEQSLNNEGQCSKEKLKNRIEGIYQGLEDGKANAGDAKSVRRSGGEARLETQRAARGWWLRLILLPVSVVFGIIALPVTGPYTLITKLYDGLFRTRHSKKEPTRGEGSSASSG